MISSLRMWTKQLAYRVVERGLRAATTALPDSEFGLVSRGEARALARNAYRQAECLAQIHFLLPELRLGGLRGWAISPDACLALVELIEDRRPKVVLELGSGASTLAIAAAMKKWVPDGTVISVDDAGQWAAVTARELADRGLDNADVRATSIAESLAPDGCRRLWYHPSSIEDLDGIDLLFVDGPPNHVLADIRSGSLPFLKDRLSVGASVLIDDSKRAPERLLAEAWAEQTRGRIEHLNAEKGLALVTTGEHAV